MPEIPLRFRSIAVKSIRMWTLRGEECVSGGYEKKNVLKEVSVFLEKFAKENINRNQFLPQKIIKKAIS